MKIVFLSFALFISLVVGGQSLAPIEKKLIQTIEQEMEQTLQLLRQSVDINSGTYNIAGVRAVGQLYAKELKALGFTIEWISLPDSLKRAGHLVATEREQKEKNFF